MEPLRFVINNVAIIMKQSQCDRLHGKAFASDGMSFLARPVLLPGEQKTRPSCLKIYLMFLATATPPVPAFTRQGISRLMVEASSNLITCKVFIPSRFSLEPRNLL